MLTCRAVNQKVSTFAAELEIEFVVGKLDDRLDRRPTQMLTRDSKQATLHFSSFKFSSIIRGSLRRFYSQFLFAEFYWSSTGHEIAPSISLSDISIQVDSSIVFEAVAYGYPTPAVTWFKVCAIHITKTNRYYDVRALDTGPQFCSESVKWLKIKSTVNSEPAANRPTNLVDLRPLSGREECSHTYRRKVHCGRVFSSYRRCTKL